MNYLFRFTTVFGIAILLFTASATAVTFVFVSIPPQKQLVERVGGVRVQVDTLVAGNRDPHTFEPTPSQLSKLSQAQLYLYVGMPFERSLLTRIQSTNARLKMIDHKAGIILRKQDAMLELEHHTTHAHHPGSLDPHVWTTPSQMKHMAATARDALTTIDPAGKADFDHNFKALAQELDILDANIRQTLQQAKVSRFMVFHPSWGYFADQYGLTQIAIEYEGKEPGAKTVTRIINLAKQQQIKTIFVQPQFSRRAAENVAQSVGARILVMDDLAPDMIGNLKLIATSLANNP